MANEYEGIPDDIAEAMKALTTADDATVWQAAMSGTPPKNKGHSLTTAILPRVVQ